MIKRNKKGQAWTRRGQLGLWVGQLLHCRGRYQQRGGEHAAEKFNRQVRRRAARLLI